jgi:hypothetical protein
VGETSSKKPPGLWGKDYLWGGFGHSVIDLLSTLKELSLTWNYYTIIILLIIHFEKIIPVE